MCFPVHHFFLLAMFKLLVILTNYSDIYFIGGFGTVAWVDVKEYETTQPDKVAVNGAEQSLKVPCLWYYNDPRKLSCSLASYMPRIGYYSKISSDSDALLLCRS